MKLVVSQEDPRVSSFSNNDMEEIRTQTMVGDVINWAVAKAENLNVTVDTVEAITSRLQLLVPKREMLSTASSAGKIRPKVRIQSDIGFLIFNPDYANNRFQGCSIIEREKISIYWNEDLNCWAAKKNRSLAYGETLLIAGMRCYVMTKFGETISVPNDLLSFNKV